MQKQIASFVGDEPPNEDKVFVASGARYQSKDPVVIGIADHKRMSADAVGHRFADCDIGDKAKKPLLDAIVPADAAT